MLEMKVHLSSQVVQKYQRGMQNLRQRWKVRMKQKAADDLLRSCVTYDQEHEDSVLDETRVCLNKKCSVESPIRPQIGLPEIIKESL